MIPSELHDSSFSDSRTETVGQVNTCLCVQGAQSLAPSKVNFQPFIRMRSMLPSLYRWRYYDPLCAGSVFAFCYLWECEIKQYTNDRSNLEMGIAIPEELKAVMKELPSEHVELRLSNKKKQRNEGLQYRKAETQRYDDGFSTHVTTEICI